MFYYIVETKSGTKFKFKSKHLIPQNKVPNGYKYITKINLLKYLFCGLWIDEHISFKKGE